MDSKEAIKVALIVFFALFLRLFRLSEVPVGFHGDEASVGYNAYSLLKTARDQNGNFLPLAIDQFGDFRPAGYHYIAIPFIATFGLSELAVRLPAALVGGLSVIPFYLLILQLLNKQKIALIGSLLFAISPWHIALSRATSESIIALFLVLYGTYFLLRKKLSYSFLAFLLSFVFYHAARLFVPFLIVGYIFLLKPKSFTRFAMLIIFSSIFIFFASNGFGRAGQVSILKAPGEMQELRQQQSEDEGYTPWTVRALHNKATFYIATVARNYSEHFTPSFLFLEGGQPVRYKVPWTGVMYLTDIAFVFIALLVNEKILYLTILWLLLGPLPAAFTFGELPSVQRAVFMIPPLLILCAYGLDKVLKKKTIVIIFLLLIYGYQGTIFLHNYFQHSFTHEPWYRNAAEKELVFDVDRYSKEGKKIIMTSQNDNNLIFYLFYLRFDPKQFQEMGSPRDKDNLVFGNITFTYKHCPLEGSEDDPALGEAGAIYVNRGECKTPKNSDLLKDIQWPDRSVAFRILRLK